MDDGSDYQAHQHEYQDGQHAHRGIVAENGKHLGIALQVGHIVANHVQAHKQQSKADKEFTYTLGFALIGEQQNDGEAYHGQHHSRYIDFEAEQGNNPRGERGADVGAHDDANRLRQRQQTRIHKTNDHHSRCRRTLDDCGDGTTGEQTGEAITSHRRQDITQTVAGGFL